MSFVLDDLLNGIDLADVVRVAVRDEKEKFARILAEESSAPAESLIELADSADETIVESFVAQPKTYPQVTEFLSQKSKDSHVELYREYVKSFNRVSNELDSIDRSETDSRHSKYRSSKLDETFNLNALWLHELFFANCFDPHSNVYMDSISYFKLQRQWGTFDDWQKDFIACAMSCGQGWAVCGYNVFLRQYVNTMVSNHSQDVMIGLIPLIVIDCHEHVYAKDFLHNKRDYVICMMREIRWDICDERIKKAEAVAEVLK